MLSLDGDCTDARMILMTPIDPPVPQNNRPAHYISEIAMNSCFSVQTGIHLYNAFLTGSMLKRNCHGGIGTQSDEPIDFALAEFFFDSEILEGS